MFTGIVAHLGLVAGVEPGVESARLSFDTQGRLGAIALGDSIAVNGVCLTAARIRGDIVEADVMLESLDRTTLGTLHQGDRVNLEAAARLDTRLGGHLVQGHVDGVGSVVSLEPSQDWTVIRFAAPPLLMPYLVPKGSIAVDGVSLTVVDVIDRDPDGGPIGFTVSLIPTTLQHTTLGAKRQGDAVNLEADVIAKYVERSVASQLAALDHVVAATTQLADSAESARSNDDSR